MKLMIASDEKMRSYMTDKGFAVKAMRYGEMVAVFVVQTEGVDKILAETGLSTFFRSFQKSVCISPFSF